MDYDFCVNCGRDVHKLVEHTGWCLECSGSHDHNAMQQNCLCCGASLESPYTNGLVRRFCCSQKCQNTKQRYMTRVRKGMEPAAALTDALLSC